jgi:hypothetical protein
VPAAAALEGQIAAALGHVAHLPCCCLLISPTLKMEPVQHSKTCWVMAVKPQAAPALKAMQRSCTCLQETSGKQAPMQPQGYHRQPSARPRQRTGLPAALPVLQHMRQQQQLVTLAISAASTVYLACSTAFLAAAVAALAAGVQALPAPQHLAVQQQQECVLARHPMRPLPAAPSSTSSSSQLWRLQGHMAEARGHSTVVQVTSMMTQTA